MSVESAQPLKRQSKHDSQVVAPLTYSINEVNITFTRHITQLAGSTSSMINIRGTGNSLFEQSDIQTLFTFTSEELIAVINSLHKIRFFNLPTHYNIEYTAFLKEDGAVGTNAMRMADAASTSVCFNVSTYKKCVTYNALNKPIELEQLTQDLFSKVKLSISTKG